jgi:hypothetical protein
MAKQKTLPLPEQAQQIASASKTMCENLLKALENGKSIEALVSNRYLLRELRKECSNYLYRTSKTKELNIG